MLAASVIYLTPGSLGRARKVFSAYRQMEIHGESDDGRAMVVSLEVGDVQQLEELEHRLRRLDFVLEIAHHAAHFG
jgi:uncharacterized protein with ACT and thioredoxin-like domain